jgi:uncharacterized C2H2 Zn-finger protein
VVETEEVNAASGWIETRPPAKGKKLQRHIFCAVR